MPKVIRIHEYGGPEQLKYEDIELPALEPDQVHLKQTAIGLNFIDIYQRTGLYPLGELPAVLGMEGCGIVQAVGADVVHFREGDRVAYATTPVGAYAEERIMPAHHLVKVPKEISDQQAAAMMLQGMTARYLIRSTYQVKPGDRVLFHAIAGGVGLIACQWLKHIGATVIGTVGSDEKAKIAKEHGCDHVILYKSENIVDQVNEITDGAGVPVVYDSVGKDTFEQSLDCLAPLGMMVSFGNSSGPIESFEPGILAQKGSLFFTRPTLFHYTAAREQLDACANDLFDVVRLGAVKIEINQTYALSDAISAHRDLEARKTVGSTVLIP